MNSKSITSSLLLLLAALIWGSAFIAQSLGMEHIGPLSFVCIRSFIGFFALIPVLLVIQKIQKKKLLAENALQPDSTSKKVILPKAIKGGIVCGIFLSVGMICQQYGILYLTESGGNIGKAGFITTMYILIVPILGLFFKQKVSPRLWVSVALAIVALYLLSVTDSFTISIGDSLLILCAFGFAAQILAADYFVKDVNGVLISCLQFLFCALITVIPAILIEKPSPEMILPAWQSLIYTGAFSSGIAFTLQIVAQKNLHPAVASLLMSCESVFAVLSGFAILGQIPSIREIIGSVIMFAAVILAQLPAKNNS
ncbi:MAG: DMT family transporter [Ruminococcaceae bacterium]|nr:DMT family transporter [Oscillospiraceae bacterium]